jgi:NIMA (never in mitosis gene a)-related kinase
MKKKYEIFKLIGKGNYGKAYLVKNTEDNNLYVNKVIDMSQFSKDQLENALREAEILKSLQHPNIIRCIDFFVDDKLLCLVTEFADLGDLNKIIKYQILSGYFFCEEIILNWFTQLCFAIKYIHSKNILHRDLKLSNIFLTSKRNIKLGDFGIAKILSSKDDLAKTLVGTPYYLSPELCLKKPYNHKSDIWSLGCILYEMMYLKHAFEAESIGELVLNILQGNFNTKINAGFSNDVVNLLKSILVINTKIRPSIDDILNSKVLQKYITMNVIRLCEQLPESTFDEIFYDKESKNKDNNNKNKKNKEKYDLSKLKIKDNDLKGLKIDFNINKNKIKENKDINEIKNNNIDI